MQHISGTLLVVLAALLCVPLPAATDPIRAGWPQPGGPGTDVTITYSYSNLLDGTFLIISSDELRAATAEALRVWAKHAPLHFFELPDSGPPPSDASYSPDGHPQIRIGHHSMLELAHAFYPDVSDGLGGDVHFDSGIPWTLGTGHWNFLEAITHEIGHTLGLDHDVEHTAIMNPFYPQQRFTVLGTAFLFPADIEHLQTIYGGGRGSVQRLEVTPEPGTLVLVITGVAAILRVRRRREILFRRPDPGASSVGRQGLRG